MTDRSQFYIGQVVHHRKFDYRGVIVDVDAEFEGDDEWYEQVAISRPPKNAPWYHILVDNADYMTYVAERHLETDDSLLPVNHPYITNIFGSFNDGVYQRRERIN
jgi:heat shock protein HspQ